MFVPPSPSQAEDTPVSVRRPKLLYEKAAEMPCGSTRESAAGAEDTETEGRMVDKRKRSGITAEIQAGAGTAAAEESSGDDLLPETHGILDEEEGTSAISLSEATKILDGDDWRATVAVLRQLHDQFAAAAGGALGAEDSGALVPFMESLAIVCRALKTAKPEIPGAGRVTQLVCAVISGLAKASGNNFCGLAAGIIPDLLPFLSTPRETVQEAVAGSIEDMLAECPAPSVLRAATVPLAGSKTAFLRRKGSGFLCVAIDRWPRDILRTTLPPIMGQMRKALFDADATVRREGRHTFGVFIRRWPAEGGGMYHALDRANQRAVLQEQPHVSNFVSKASKDGTGAGAARAAPTAAAVPAITAITAAKPAASALEPPSSSTACGVSASDDSAAEASSSANAAAAAAASSAATRAAIATSGGGGGGQRPPGVTQAQHRSIVALKLEKDRKLKDQQRLAAAGLKKTSSSSSLLSATSCGGRSRVEGRNPVLTDDTAAVVGASGCGAGGSSGGVGGGGRNISLLSIPVAMHASPPCSPAAAAGVAGGSGFHSPCSSSSGGGGIGGGASRVAAASSCSDGLRRAAQLALRKNNLMSPTLKRLLLDPSQLQRKAATATVVRAGGDGTEADVSSPVSEESGLDTAGGGGGGGSGRMNPCELRGSTRGSSPWKDVDASNSRCLSSGSSSSDRGSSDEEFNDKEKAEWGDGSASGRNLRLATRVLFGQEEAEGRDGAFVKAQPSPKQQRTSVIARAAANASAERYAALEMNPPPPRLSAVAAAVAVEAKSTATFGGSSLSTGAAEGHRQKMDGIAPNPSPQGGSVSGPLSCGTPTKGILAERSRLGKDDGAGADSVACSSAVKRRVRFETEEQAREAAAATASLVSPCRSSSSTLATGWGTTSADTDDGEIGVDDGCGGEQWRLLPRRLQVILSTLAASVSVGAVAFLGGGAAGGDGCDWARGTTAVTTPRLACLDTSSFCSAPCLPWLVEYDLDVCAASAVHSDGIDAGLTVDVLQEDRTTRATELDHATEVAAGASVDATTDELFQDAAGAAVAEDASGEDVFVGVQQGAAEDIGDESVKYVVEDVVEGVVQVAAKALTKEDVDILVPDIIGTTADMIETDHGRQSSAHDHHPNHLVHSVTGVAGGVPCTSTGASSAASESATSPTETGIQAPPSSTPGGSDPAVAALPASKFASPWGWVEVGAATLGAAAILAAAVWSSRDALVFGGGEGRARGDECGDVGSDPSTPQGGGGNRGGSSEGEELGRYQTLELVKVGGTPATLRSVRRSRRIGSAQKPSSSSGTIIMDLGAAALNLSSAWEG